MPGMRRTGNHRPRGPEPEEQAAELRGAQDRLTQRVLAVADAVGRFIEAWGFKAILGKVWALLALRRAPMAQTEIAEALGVSRSLVNLAITELTARGLVRATSDHRNAPYEARLDIWPTITDVLRAREWMLIESARVALEAAIHEAELEGGSGRYDMERMRLLKSMAEFAQLVLRLVFSLRVPRSLESFERWMGEARGFLKRLRLIRAA
jgi:DNA-binding transcriptional regulator GbsR (MarR family)